MKNKGIMFTAILLVVALGSYSMVISDGTIRTVEFLSIFALGALAGVLVTQIFASIKEGRKQHS